MVIIPLIQQDLKFLTATKLMTLYHFQVDTFTVENTTGEDDSSIVVETAFSF